MECALCVDHFAIGRPAKTRISKTSALPSSHHMKSSGLLAVCRIGSGFQLCPRYCGRRCNARRLFDRFGYSRCHGPERCDQLWQFGGVRADTAIVRSRPTRSPGRHCWPCRHWDRWRSLRFLRVVNLIRDPDSFVRIDAVQTAVKLGDDSVPVFGRVAARPDWRSALSCGACNRRIGSAAAGRIAGSHGQFARYRSASATGLVFSRSRRWGLAARPAIMMVADLFHDP